MARQSIAGAKRVASEIAKVEGPTMPRLTPITERSQVSQGDVPEFDIIMYSPTITGHSTEWNDPLRANISKHDYDVVVLVAASEFPIFVW